MKGSAFILADFFIMKKLSTNKRGIKNWLKGQLSIFGLINLFLRI